MEMDNRNEGGEAGERLSLRKGSSITLRATSAGLIFPGLVNVGEEAGEALFEQFLDLAIVLQVATEGVGDVFAAQAVIGGEFGDEIDLVLGLGKVIQDGRQVPTTEGKDVASLLHEVDRHRFAAMAGEVLAMLLCQSDAVLARLLA